MNALTRFVLFSFGTSLLCACTSQKTVNFSVVKESNQCRIQNAAISSLSLEQDQETLIRSLTGFSDTKVSQSLRQSFDAHLKTEDLYLISQGRQTSAGYGFVITGNTGSLTNKHLTLPISFSSPEPGSMTAQVMTSPCLVVGVESGAQFEKLIVDKLSVDTSN